MTKTAAITGTASGIGKAAAQRLLDAGWTVYGLDRAAQAARAHAVSESSRRARIAGGRTVTEKRRLSLLSNGGAAAGEGGGAERATARRLAQTTSCLKRP